MLHGLWRGTVVPSVTVSVKGQAVTCMCFGAFTELYLTWCVSLPASGPPLVP